MKCKVLASENAASPAGLAYKNVARRILGETVPLLDLDNDGSFKYKLKRIFKRKNKSKSSGIRKPQVDQKPTDGRINT